MTDEGSHITYPNSAEMIERELYYYYQSSTLELEMESLIGDQIANADEVIEVEQFELRVDPEGTDDQ